MLKKNVLLKIRSKRKGGCCKGRVAAAARVVPAWRGALGFLFELLLPTLLVVLLSIPKLFLEPVFFPQLRAPGVYPIQSLEWVVRDCPKQPADFPIECFNPKWWKEWSRGKVLYAPNGPKEQRVMELLAKDISCPLMHDGLTGRQLYANESGMYHAFWDRLHIGEGSLPGARCLTDRAYCLSEPSCYDPVLGIFEGFSSEQEAVERSMEVSFKDKQNRTRAVIVFEDMPGEPDTQSDLPFRYLIRMNHTMAPTTTEINDHRLFNPQLDATYMRKYWFFANLQLSVDKSLMTLGLSEGQPAGSGGSNENKAGMGGDDDLDLEVQVHHFPAPEFEMNPDAVIAGAFIDFCLVVAFLVPMRSNVAAIVSEKELRLRAGMRLLGVTDFAYWTSWAITHAMQLMVSSAAMAAVATIPFPNSSGPVIFLFFALLSLSMIPLGYLLTCLFQRTSTAGPATVLIFVVFMIPGTIYPAFEEGQANGQENYNFFLELAGFLSPSCVPLFGVVLRHLEFSGQGLKWETMFTAALSQEPLTPAGLLVRLSRNTLLYFVMFLYFDKALPDESGRRLPFYFPFTSEFWEQQFGWEKRPSGYDQTMGLLRQNRWGSSGLVIENLTKEYSPVTGGKVVAVDDLCLQASVSQVFGLLGHNGAGKTTTMDIITGILSPTSGDVFVRGRSVLNEMHVIRKSLGLCPQFDILWPTLTVHDHLKFFAQIKGIRKGRVRFAVENMAKEVGLSDKLNCPSCELSGGQKRKLSVGIAFMGNPFLVVLDEPTSGMDPRSRRDTWDIIRKNRNDRLIMLSTHFMDEADILCDNIGIMHRGRLAAIGSPLELKESYGAGYLLTLLFGESSVVSKVEHSVAAIRKHAPDAQIVGNVGAELNIRIDKRWTDIFPELMEECQQLEDESLVKSYGLSYSTLEEAFINVTQASEGSKAINQPLDTFMEGQSKHRNHHRSLSNISNLSLDSIDFGADAMLEESLLQPDRAPKLQGRRLLCQQFKALLWKKYLCTTRDRLTVAVQLLIPLLLVLAALSAGRASSGLPTIPSLTFDRDVIFGDSKTLFGASEGFRRSPDYPSFMANYGKEYLLDINVTDLAEIPSSFDSFALDNWYRGANYKDFLFVQNFTATEATLGQFVVSVNYTLIQALPQAINGLTSAMSRMTGVSGGIHMSRNPLPLRESEKVVKERKFVLSFLFVFCTIMACSSLAASFSMFVVQERANKCKQVQLVSGAHKAIFWAAHFIWDMTMYMIPASAILVCFLAFDLPEFKGVNFPAVIVILLAYGLASIPATYVLHFVFDEAFKAFLRLWTLFFLSGYIFFLVDWIFAVLSRMTRACKVIHDTVAWVFPILSPQFNIGKALYNLQINENNPLGIAAAKKPPFDMSVAGKSILFLFTQTVAFSLLCLVIEYQLWSKLKPFYYRLKAGDEEDGLTPVGGSDDDYVMVDHLNKRYLPYLPKAVDDLSFSVKRNECFGLLGVNGAGKTTTFKILTGEIGPESGTALICGSNIVTQTQRARLKMGYCPQFEAVVDNMTGHEMLQMYAMIRGIAPDLIEDNVKRIISKLGLPYYANKLSGTYSGGNKRKLAMAAAIVGDPSVILLDEPSTGVDAVAKRFLWNVIQEMYSSEGKCVVLTSHSMTECEALCSRIGIMVAGRFRCLGHIQEIKNHFGGGYYLEFRFQSTSQLNKMEALMKKAFPFSMLVENTDLYCLFQIKQEDVNLPRIFRFVRDIKEDNVFEAFSVSQTSLEQVFIKLANDAV